MLVLAQKARTMFLALPYRLSKMLELRLLRVRLEKNSRLASLLELGMVCEPQVS